MPQRRSADSLREVALRLTRNEVKIKVYMISLNTSSAQFKVDNHLRFISHNLELTCCGQGVIAALR